MAYPIGKALGLLHPPEEAADTAVHLASAPELEGVTGSFFVKRNAVALPPELEDPEAGSRLWEISSRMTGLADRRPLETVKE